MSEKSAIGVHLFFQKVCLSVNEKLVIVHIMRTNNSKSGGLEKLLDMGRCLPLDGSKFY